MAPPKAGGVCDMQHCKNYKLQKDARSFYRFPKDLAMCKQWVHWCKRSDLDAVLKDFGPIYMNNNHRICSDHFALCDLRNPQLTSQGLKEGSIPSVNLPQGHVVKKCRPSPRKRHFSPVKSHVDPSEDLPNSVDNLSEGIHPYVSPAPEPQNKMARFSMSDEQNKKYSNARKQISKLKGVVAGLRQENYRLRKMLQDNNLLEKKGVKSRASDPPASTIISNVAIPDQYVAGDFFPSRGRKPCGRRYTEKEKNFALGLHDVSPRAYRYMRTLFCLPTVRQVRRWLQDANVSPGLNESG